MRIYVSHASSFDYQNKLYIPLMNSPLSKEHEFIFPHEHAKHGEYSRELIASCGLLIADVSVPSIGTGIEIGWANAAGIPVVAVYEKGSTPSSSIPNVTQSLHEYESSAECMKILEGYIRKSQ